MKVSKEKLKQMIKEELEAVMKEGESDLAEEQLGEEVELEESIEDLEEVKAVEGNEDNLEETQIEELRESFRRFTKLPKAVLKD